MATIFGNPITSALRESGISETVADVGVVASQMGEFFSGEAKAAALSMSKMSEDVRRVIAAAMEKLVPVATVTDFLSSVDIVSILFDVVKLLKVNTVKEMLFVFAEAFHHLGFGREIISRVFNAISTYIASWKNGSEEGEEDEEGRKVRKPSLVAQGGIFESFSLREFVTISAVAMGSAFFNIVPTGIQMSSLLKDVGNMCKNVHALSLGMKGISYIGERLCDVFRYVYKHVLYRWLPDTWIGQDITSIDIREFYEEILSFEDPTKMEDLMREQVLQTRVLLLVDRAQEIRKAFGENKKLATNLFEMCFKKLDALRILVLGLKSRTEMRREPFSIQLFGEPGAGKSRLVPVIVDYLCEKGDEEVAKTNRVYARTSGATDQYWNGYTGQHAVTIDDIFQVNSADAPTTSEFIFMKSAVPWIVPMANLSDKARTFVSQLLVTTTNVSYPQFNHINSAMALWRRRDVLWEVTSLRRVDDPKDFANIRVRFMDPLTPGGFLLDGQYFTVSQALEETLRMQNAFHMKRKSFFDAFTHNGYRACNLGGVPGMCCEHGEECVEETCIIFRNRALAPVIPQPPPPLPPMRAPKRVHVPTREFFPTFQAQGRTFYEYPKYVLRTCLPVFDGFRMRVVKIQGLRENASNAEDLQRAIQFLRVQTSEDVEEQVQNDWIDKTMKFHAMLGTNHHDVNWTEHQVHFYKYKNIKGAISPETVNKLKFWWDQGYRNRCFGVWRDQALCTQRPSEIPIWVQGPIFVAQGAQGNFDAKDPKWMELARKDINIIHEPLHGDFHVSLDKVFAMSEELVEVIIAFNSYLTKDQRNLVMEQIIGEKIEKRSIEFQEEIAAQSKWMLRQRFQQWVKMHPVQSKIVIGVGVLVVAYGAYRGILALKNLFSSDATVPSGDQVTRRLARPLIKRDPIHVHKVGGARARVSGIYAPGKNHPSTITMQQMQDGRKKETTYVVKEILGGTLKAVAKSAVLSYGLGKLLHPSITDSWWKRIGMNMATRVALDAAGKGLRNVEHDFTRGFSECVDPEVGVERVLHNIPFIGPSHSMMPRQDVASGIRSRRAQDVITNRILPNMYALVNCAGMRMKGLVIRDTWMMMPFHFVHDALVNGNETADFMEPLSHFFSFQRNGQTIQVPYDPQNIRFFNNADGTLAQDLVLYKLPRTMQAHADLTRHFATEQDVANVRPFHGLFVGLQNNTIPLMQQIETKPVGNIRYGGPNNDEYVLLRGLAYQSSSVAGDCGSVIVADDDLVQHCIWGIHVLGQRDGVIGGCEIVTQESIEQAIGGDTYTILPCIEDEMGILQDGPHYLKAQALTPGGDVDFLGATPPKLSIRQPEKSDICPSLIHDVAYQHLTEPAPLTPKDPRVSCSPLKRGLEKFSEPSLPFRPDIIRQAADDLSDVFKKLKRPDHLSEVLDTHRGINGDPRYPFVDAINMQTSPGWPYVLKRPSTCGGKQYLFEGDVGNWTIKDDTLKNQLTARIWSLTRGERIQTRWTDCLKDERRPLAKVAEGKTRLFNIAPVDYTIAFRMYFLGFSAFYYDTRLDHEGAPGIDCESPEWTRLTNILLDNSDLLIASDFSQFDGKLDPALMWESARIINDWYDDGQENARARFALMEEMIHSYHQVNNCVYLTHRGNPSGNPLTVIINTMVNALYQRCVYLELAEEHGQWEFCSMTAYHRMVRYLFYGDDLIGTVKYMIAEWYNQITIAACFQRHGFEITTADKRGVSSRFQSIGEVSFLKRGFRKDEVRPHVWHPTMDVTTIQELTNWVRKNDDPVEALLVNVETAQRFAYHHGKTYFERMQGTVNNALCYRGLPRVTMSYRIHQKNFFEMFG